MDDRFATRDDDTVTEYKLTPKYNDDSYVLLGDVVFDVKPNNKIMGPYVVKSIGQTPIGVIITLDPMPIIGPSKGTAIEDASTLRKATKSDILTLEAKWPSENAIKKAQKFKSLGCRIAKIWHLRGHELLVIRTGGAPLTRIPLKVLSKRIDSEDCILDWTDITDVTEDKEYLKNVRDNDIPNTVTCDVTDAVLDDQQTIDAISKYLQAEYEMNPQIIQTLCDAAVSIANKG